MAKQMKQLGMNIKLMGGETMNSAKFIELAGPAAEGAIASTPGAALESRPGGKAFADKYKARFGQDIGLYAPYFYDGVMAIAAAMKAANSTDPAKYLPALAKINYKGVTADIAFDRAGRPDARPRRLQFPVGVVRPVTPPGSTSDAVRIAPSRRHDGVAGLRSRRHSARGGTRRALRRRQAARAGGSGPAAGDTRACAEPPANASA